ncbi:hypothetical protein VTN77DRAFT_1445 [Rasamsonia byssochlamydoides]|uniref:uncharacterized protein n=1 Tax=Rasamsonia byssochlamydoides TaxID=89139 RepID=UPI00374474DD
MHRDGVVILKDVIDPAHLEKINDIMIQDSENELRKEDLYRSFGVENIQQGPPLVPSERVPTAEELEEYESEWRRLENMSVEELHERIRASRPDYPLDDGICYDNGEDIAFEESLVTDLEEQKEEQKEEENQEKTEKKG